MSTHAEVQQQMRGRAEIPVACVCGWDNGGRLTLVDRYAQDFPPVPWMDMREVYLDDGHDPDDRAHECGGCGDDLDPDALAERTGVAR